jgi:hypothetical protein
VLPIAATEFPGDSTRLDAFRGRLAADLLERLASADDDAELSEALDRWELSLFQNEPYRSEQLRAAARALLGETWPLRGAVVIGEDEGSRERIHGELASLGSGSDASTFALDAVRRMIVAVLREGDRDDLLRRLDRQLLGLEPRQQLRAVV